MSLEMQAKLLRVLQTGEIKPVGDVATRRVQLRIIAATNRDLEAAIRRGEFRADLFYRFNTFTITLPPLRERVEDIPILAAHFLRKAEAKVNKKVERVSPEAIQCLERYFWPGNLRELENTIERGVVLAPSGQIVRYGCSYRGMDYPNQEIVCRGTITKKYQEGGQNLVELDIWTETGKPNDDARPKNPEGIKTTPGTAVVALPKR